MSNINTFTVSGKLTRDFEVRAAGETSVASGSIAVNRQYMKGEERVEEVSFFDITVWGRYGDLCARKLRKADDVTVSGRLKQDTWEDKETGAKRSKVHLIADQIDSVGFYRSKDEDNQPGEASAPDAAGPSEDTAAPATPATDTGDDIPF